jgi:hypothetical protein
MNQANLLQKISSLGVAILSAVSTVGLTSTTSQAADFARLQSQICDNLPKNQLFCVDPVISVSKDWFYDNPKLSPLIYDGSWESDPFGSDASGRRFWEITNQSYQIDFMGNFEEVLAIGWNGNLLQQNDNKNKGELIPVAWRNTNGYNLPVSASVFNFSREYTVNKTRLTPGELGCPSGENISHCDYVNSFLGASTELGGQVSARGDITQIAAAVTESVIINAAILRNTKILLNDNARDTIASGIGNQVSKLSIIEDGGLQPKNISVKGKVKVEGTPKDVSFSGEGTAKADFIYEQDEEVASIFAKYLEEASSNFLNAGNGTNFKLTLNDSIGMTADIRGVGFTAADVFTDLRLQNPQSSAFTVFNVVRIPEPTSTLSLLALGTLRAASTLKRKLKPSKSVEKELEKIS